MRVPMTALDEPRTLQAIDATFHYGGVALRALGYLAVFAIAQRYDCGRAMLTGVIAGDLLGQLLALLPQWQRGLLVQACDLLLLGLIWLLARQLVVWPDDPAMRAIVGLAAFGALSGHIGSNVLTHLGPVRD